MAGEDRHTAAARLSEATSLGLSSASEPIGIEAWARRAWLDGTTGHPDTALDGFAVIDALAAQPSPALGFARALLHNNVGSVDLAAGNRRAALAVLTRALDEARSVTGPGAVELVAIRTNIAIATDDAHQRDSLLDEAQAAYTRLLGARHPDTLRVQLIRAGTIVSFAGAAARFEPACREQELYPWLAPLTTLCWTELADLRAELGDRPAAIAAVERAQALGPAISYFSPEAGGYRLLWRDDPTAALAAFDAALAQSPEQPGEPWYVTYTRARLILGRGRALAALAPTAHRADAAIALARSVAMLESIAHDQRDISVQRRLARARAELADLRAHVGAPPDAVRPLAAAALTWMRTAGAPAAELARLELLARDR
jgi:tetratricopeptide (TPR) repeat protein